MGKNVNVRFGATQENLTPKHDRYEINNISSEGKLEGLSVSSYKENDLFKDKKYSFKFRDPEEGEEIFILLHPLGKPLQVSYKDCFIDEANVDAGSEILAGFDKTLSKRQLFSYECDTDPGAGGAPIFAVKDGAVVGIVYVSDKTNEANFAKKIPLSIVSRN
jgi:hypothetical protein